MMKGNNKESPAGNNIEHNQKNNNLPSTFHQPTWQRIALLVILAYEGLGALSGGSFLVAAPDGRIMDMPVEIMHGFFADFFVPGLILIGLGVLNAAAFIAVLIRMKMDWLLSALGMGSLAIWFIVEIIVLKGFHWLHAMWGLLVLFGCILVIPLVSMRLGKQQLSPGT